MLSRVFRRAISTSRVLQSEVEEPLVKKNNGLYLRFVTPYETIFNGRNVHEVYWSANGARLGLRGNNPQSINQLSPGTVSVVDTPGAEPKSWFVPGGFGLVNEDGVSRVCLLL